MHTKKWILGSALIVAGTTMAVLALTNPVRIFRTTAQFIGVSQQQNSDHPKYDYAVGDGSNLVALALGANPTSNQVFALSIDCASSAASLVVFDKSNSNQVPIATCDGLQIVQNRGPKSAYVNSERFVGQFNVPPNGAIAGGTLMVAGRLDLDSNGCPTAVTIALDKDAQDKDFDDSDVADTDQDAKIKDVLRAGQGHMVGWLNLVSGNSTNLLLIPLGHLTFRHDLEQFDVTP